MASKKREAVKAREQPRAALRFPALGSVEKGRCMPHVPDGWIDESKTKVGYEIPLNRHFYVYEPPRSLEVIEADIKTLEGEIFALLKEVTA
jgi:hypothetical protein